MQSQTDCHHKEGACSDQPARGVVCSYSARKPHERTIGPQDGGAGTPGADIMVNILFFITDSGDIKAASGPQAQVLTGVQFREEVRILFQLGQYGGHRPQTHAEAADA